MSQGLLEPSDVVHARLLLCFVLLGISSGRKQGNETFCWLLLESIRFNFRCGGVTVIQRFALPT